MTETGYFHQSQFDQQPLVRRLPDSSVGFGQQRDRPEKKFDCTTPCLGAVSLQQGARQFDERHRSGIARHEQVAHVLRQTGHEGLAGESFGEHLVEQPQRREVVAAEQHVGDVEIGVVVQHVERLRDGLVFESRAAERHGLVEHRQCVAHTAVGFLRDEVQRLLVVADALLPCDIFEVLD